MEVLFNTAAERPSAARAESAGLAGAAGRAGDRGRVQEILKVGPGGRTKYFIFLVLRFIRN